MNRTSEFFKYIKREPRPASGPRTQATRKQTPFSDASQEINRRLLHASESIDTLRSLVRGGNILGQDDIQIQELIVNLNRDLGITDQRIKDVEGMKSQPQHAARVAQNLRRNLQSVTEDFKSVIQERGEIIQKLTERRRGISTAPMSYSTFSTVYGNDDEVEVPMQGQFQIEQQRERYDMVRGVEQSITEISELLIHLSEIISSHDYTIDRIDELANETMNGIEKGQKELKNYYDKVKGNKCLMIKIFVVLIVFALIFIIIV